MVEGDEELTAGLYKCLGTGRGFGVLAVY